MRSELQAHYNHHSRMVIGFNTCQTFLGVRRPKRNVRFEVSDIVKDTSRNRNVNIRFL